MVTFRKKYLFLTLLLFAVEILIAAFVKDKVIRPYGGDFLAVILLYCFFRTFTKMKVFATAIFVLGIACIIETMQYFRFLQETGLNRYKFASLIVGHSFEWADIFTYCAAAVAIVAAETFRKQKLQSSVSL